MKWNNKFILQTDMVEVNAKQCQDKKESDQAVSITTNSLEANLILDFEESYEARQGRD